MDCTCQEICGLLREHRLPKWNEIPELDYYMDQVLALVDRYLGDYPGYDKKGLTASMVNNYVKMGVLNPPQKKRYSRTHLAQLLMICILKTSLPIAAVKNLLDGIGNDRESFYNRFTELFSETNAETADALLAGQIEKAPVTACRAALRAQAEQALAVRLCSELPPTEL